MDGCTDGVTAALVSYRVLIPVTLSEADLAGNPVAAKPTWLSPRDHPSIREALFRPFGYSS